MTTKSGSKLSSGSWNWSSAKHLLNRAGFGGKPVEVSTFVEAGMAGCLKQLFDLGPAPLKEPEWLSDFNSVNFSRIRGMSADQRREFTRRNRQKVRQLQIDWVKRMIAAKSPSDMLWEKMTFFWHGHFATSAQKVKLPPLVYQQLSLFHNHAIGSFRKLLHGIARDPAMLRYLDNNQNRKGKPNENFARELMELFSLGPGNYTEHDIRESARAFTGWTHDPLNFRMLRRRHDYGQKTFLGKTGNFDGGDIVNIILEQPACAEFITRKLLRFFGPNQPRDDLVKSLAANFRDYDYELAPLLRDIFSHPDFYSDEVVGSQIKSPIQLVIGTMRTLGVEIRNDRFYLQVLEMMGQIPYLPPNVKGWPGGNLWIDTSRLLTRYTFAQIISSGKIPEELDPRSGSDPERQDNERRRSSRFDRMMRRGNLGIEFDPNTLLTGQSDIEETVTHLEKMLLSVSLLDGEHDTLVKNYQENLGQMAETEALKSLVGDIMTLPAYQLC